MKIIRNIFIYAAVLLGLFACHAYRDATKTDHTRAILQDM